MRNNCDRATVPPQPQEAVSNETTKSGEATYAGALKQSVHQIRTSPRRRTKRGSALTEFGPALTIFVLCFFVPLIDLGFLPVRCGTAYGTVDQCVHRISRSETMSEAWSRLNNDNWWSTFMKKCGITIDSKELALKIVSKEDKDKKVVVPFGSAVPADWLPNGPNGPCIYYLQLTVNTHIEPFFRLNFFGLGVPGLTEPAPMQFMSSAAWENLGRNPDTDKYFMNE